MAKLAPVIDALDAVPEPLREFYQPGEGGKFVLDTELDTHPGTAGLRSKNQELIRREKALADRLKPFEGLDPEEVSKAIDARKKAEEDRIRKEGDFETAKKQMAEAHAKEKTEWDKERQGFVSTIERRVQHAEAASALAGKGANTKLLMPHVLQQSKTIKEGDEYVAIVIDAKGKQRYHPTTGEPMTIDDLVSEMMTKDEYKAGFPAPDVKGSGARGSERQGTAGDIKLTKDQAKDPAAYRRAKDEAAKRGVNVVFLDT